MTFPSSSFYNHRIPKQKFYEHIPATAEIKRLFVEQIDSILWQNKLSPSTLNVEAGQFVKEIEVFRVKLNQSGIDEKILRLIDESIPYHIVFLLDREEKTAIGIGFKKIGENRQANKVVRYFFTDSKSENELELPISGLSMDAIYENMIKYVAGEGLVWKEGDALEGALTRMMEDERIDREIAALRVKIRSERQFNRQVEMNEMVRELTLKKNE